MTTRSESSFFASAARILGATLNGIVIATRRPASSMRWPYQSSMLSAMRGEKNSAIEVAGMALGGFGLSWTALVTARECTGSALSSFQ